MTNHTLPIDETTLDGLASDLKGRLVRPQDPDYDEVRLVFLGSVDGRPAAIARVADAQDVATVVGFAARTGADLAVRSGGHSGAGHSTTDGGIVIDLRDVDGFELDAENRTAWAGAGLSAAEYTAAAAEHGLATGFGDTGSVGIGGITLGGGVGYFARRFGMTIDDLLAAEIVTADGQIRQVDAETEPDLFWAIRGGGGNLGVVTRFRFRLHPVSTVVGGMLVLPASAEVIAGFVAEADRAPEELSTIANVMSAPPMPFLPESAYGTLVVLAFMAYSGPEEEAEAVYAPFRALAEPLADMVRPIPYPEMYPPEDPDYHPMAANRTMFVDTVGLDEARTIMDHLAASDAMMRVAQVRVLGGAMARVPVDATAFAHRTSRIMVNVAAIYEDPKDREQRETWVADLSEALQQGEPRAYVNFLNDEGEARVHDAYPKPTWDRLVEIKTRYDPQNLFHLNQNIPPASTG